MDIVQIYRDVIKLFERHKLSISPQHKRYLKHARRELTRIYPTKQDQEILDPYSDLILALLLLDLEALCSSSLQALPVFPLSLWPRLLHQ
jgi:hypothetical protein